MATAQFVKAGNIAGMIARIHPNMAVDLYDIVEWCADVIADAGTYETFTPNKGKRYNVINGKIQLPCNIYRLVAVRHGACLLRNNEYTRNGLYLDIHNSHMQYVDLDYLTVPTDEEGFPLVPSSHRQACYWYCIRNLYMEDYISGKITADRWKEMDNKYVGYLIQAKQTFENSTVNDQAEISMILHNMIMSVRPPVSIP